MYLEHFGLERPPFKITPDTSMFYEGCKRGAALEALIYAINSGEGMIKVVGEVGSGKTMLCRMLEVRLSNFVDIVYIANPSLSPDNILHAIAHELQLGVNNDDCKLDVMQKLQDYLLRKHADNRQVVVFVEEAQSMPVETLEEIRLLSNLETDQHKLLQMVLFGQPELDIKLSEPRIRQLRERITHSFYLEPFPPEDTLEYLNFRLRSVGYRGTNIFDQRTANAVKKYSDGLSRRINIIADKALMAAFSEGSHRVTAGHVATAAKDSKFARPVNYRPAAMTAGIALAMMLAVWLGYRLPGWITPGEHVAASLASPDKLLLAMHTAPAATKPDLTRTMAFDYPNPVLASTEFDFLKQRLVDTEAWLAKVDDGRYSIQLFTTPLSEAEAVEKFLRELPDLLDFEKIYVYDTKVGGGRVYMVLYDDFNSLNTARSVLGNLPASMKASKPYLRRVSALRKDLEPGR